MPLEKYRYYRLDGAGHLHETQWFHAESDEAAIARIEQKHQDSKCEIWHGKLLVASITPRQRSA